MSFWERLSGLIRAVVKRGLGRKKFTFSLLGIPLVTVTERDPRHFNVFLLFLPFLQVVTGPKTHTIRILLIAWILKAIKHLLTGWSLARGPEYTRFAFCGKVIYEKRFVEPYKFPSTTFQDKQVNR